MIQASILPPGGLKRESHKLCGIVFQIASFLHEEGKENVISDSVCNEINNQRQRNLHSQMASHKVVYISFYLRLNYTALSSSSGMRPSTGIKEFYFFPCLGSEEIHPSGEHRGAAPPTCLRRSDLHSVGHTICTSKKMLLNKTLFPVTADRFVLGGKKLKILSNVLVSFVIISVCKRSAISSLFKLWNMSWGSLFKLKILICFYLFIVSPWLLSILNIAVCSCQSQTPNQSLPLKSSLALP